MSVQARCPACGGPVTFAVGTSLVCVCPYCQSVVGRSDRGLETLGKVADLVETESPLDIGIQGRFDRVPFSLTGRTQYRHPAGGVWDEWYAAFTDGRWGWLAEAQGRFYLTFASTPPSDLPRFEQFRLGQTIQLNEIQFRVDEKNVATIASARGEIPYRILPNEPHPFVDLSGPQGEFATIDYSDDKPSVYVGRQVTLDELHIPNQARRRYPGQEPIIEALHLNCPKCGAALELRAPDQSERVACPSCGSLSDVKQGSLKLLQSLKPPPVQLVIPLGSVGKRDGLSWTCLGFMRRFVIFEGTNYYWEEYLLYHPRQGFRWLTRSDDHWNWVESIPGASVVMHSDSCSYADRNYRLFQVATAYGDFVVGEFYWKVESGETVQSKDFVHAPYMLSLEITGSDKSGEVNWSHATYLEAAEVESMFGLPTPLPRPSNIGPNQPFPYTHIYQSAFLLIAVAFLLGFGFWLISPKRTVYHQTLPVEPVTEGRRAQRITVDEPLRLRARENIRVSLTPGTEASWMHVSGSLSPRELYGAQRNFAFLAMGGERSFVYLSAVPAGEYSLGLELTPGNSAVKTSAEVRIEQGVAHPFPFLVTLGLLGGVPILTALYQLWFEARRWQESNTSADSEDDE